MACTLNGSDLGKDGGVAEGPGAGVALWPHAKNTVLAKSVAQITTARGFLHLCHLSIKKLAILASAPISKTSNLSLPAEYIGAAALAQVPWLEFCPRKSHYTYRISDLPGSVLYVDLLAGLGDRVPVSAQRWIASQA